jgi:ABC-type transport system involved in multi-copper enzyme maturation permease subunit
VSALFALTLRQILGGAKLWLLALFLGLPVLLAAVVVAQGGFDLPDQEEVAMGIFLYVLYPQSLCILAALLYGSSLLAAEIEGKTLVYLFTRPVPRALVLLWKYLATVSALVGLTVVSLTLSFALAGFAGGARMYLTLLATVVAALLAYTAIFCLLGLVVPRRAIPAGLIYAVLVEVVLSFVPAVANEIAVSHYLRSLALQLSGRTLPPEVQEVFTPVPLGTCVLALAVFPTAFLGLSALLVHRREWPLTEGV